MDKEVEEAIQRADRYINSRDYGLAWKTLRPYQEYPEARKRLVWLKKKHAQIKQEKAQTQVQRRRPGRIWIAGGLVVAVVVVVLLASGGMSPGTRP